jgi:hypothetical protein
MIGGEEEWNELRVHSNAAAGRRFGQRCVRRLSRRLRSEVGKQRNLRALPAINVERAYDEAFSIGTLRIWKVQRDRQMRSELQK